MEYKAILFDLDGTLLPMDMNKFTQGYFGELAKVMAQYGIDGETLTKCIWYATKAMMQNDGSKSNMEVFWDNFISVTKLNKAEISPTLDTFYTKEFNNAKKCTEPNPLAKQVVDLAHNYNRKVALASNPIFPLDGQISRLNWVGLQEIDFDLITSYESESYCKPHKNYYLSICQRLGVQPQDCLMIGNDLKEDMYGASEAGINCYLVEDCIIDNTDFPYNGKRGSFEDLLEILK